MSCCRFGSQHVKLDSGPIKSLGLGVHMVSFWTLYGTLEVMDVVDTGRRRRFSVAELIRIVEESLSGPNMVRSTARRYGVPFRVFICGAGYISVVARAPVLDPGRKATKSGYFWAVVADDHGHGGACPPIDPMIAV